MPFTLSSIAAKDSAGTAIGGGLLAADKAGGGAGPFILAHLLVDGIAGTNLAKVDASNRVSMSLDNIAAALTLATVTTLGTITNVVHVDDNSGSLTVDNAGTFAVQAAIKDGAGNLLTSAVRGSERALSVQLVDGSGNQVTSFSGPTQYTEDIAAATDPVGSMLIGVRRDTLSTSEVGADGRNIALKATSRGQLHVANADGAGNLLTSAVRGSERALSVQLVDGSGNQVTSFSGPTQYTEDVASAADPVGSMLMAVRRDTLSATEVSADSDNIAVKATSKGQVHVLAEITSSQLSALSTTAQAMAAGYQLVGLASDQVKIPTVGNVAHDAVGTSENPLLVGGYASAAAPSDVSADGDAVRMWLLRNGSPVVTLNGSMVAHGATDANNPVKTGAQARTTNPTAVSDAQRVNFIADKLGKQITVGAIRELKGVTQTQISNTTSETTIVASVASTFCDLYGLILANTGATTTKVTIKDATAGTTRAIIEVPTLETRGFMVSVDSAVPQATVNNNWTATCSAATTAMEVTAMWVKNT